jgi:hypothetical protein
LLQHKEAEQAEQSEQRSHHLVARKQTSYPEKAEQAQPAERVHRLEAKEREKDEENEIDVPTRMIGGHTDKAEQAGEAQPAKIFWFHRLFLQTPRSTMS